MKFFHLIIIMDNFSISKPFLLDWELTNRAGPSELVANGFSIHSPYGLCWYPAAPLELENVMVCQNKDRRTGPAPFTA